MPDALTFYLNKFEKLRTAKIDGKPAPHKPLLLLAVIDLFEEGAISGNWIEPSPRFVEAFLKYWHIVSLEKPRVYLPFFHLRSDKFWHLHPKAGNERLFAQTKQMNSMAHLANLVAYAALDEDLFILLHRAEAREAFRRRLVETYFTEHAEKFFAVIADNREISGIEHFLLDQAKNDSADLSKQIKDTPKRNVAFRRLIIRLYDYTCAACRLRLITIDGETAVEAAHIYPFAQSFDDSIGNGLSLCPLHHWSFDKGLFTIGDDYKMLVSKNFEETGNEAFLLRNLREKEIHLPKEIPYRPSLTMIRWHRENSFQN